MKKRILKLWTYFRRGHTTYLSFLMNFANFIVIQYRLLIENISLLEMIFTSITVFVFTFFFLYIPIAVIIGYMDYTRGSVPVDLEISALNNPFSKDLLQAIIYLSEGKSEEVKAILSKWI